MWLWIGIDVDKEYLKTKDKIIEVMDKVDFDKSLLTLPFHISLKMSFLIDDNDYDKITKVIKDILINTKPFTVKVKGREVMPNIIWARYFDNEDLNKIHDELNESLLNEFNIPLHEYDLDYKFHTTLFMDFDCNKVNKASILTDDLILPKSIRVNRFLIGVSPKGELGTYKVIEEIDIKEK